MYTVWKSRGRVNEVFAQKLKDGYTFYRFYCIFINKLCENFGGRVHFYPGLPPCVGLYTNYSNQLITIAKSSATHVLLQKAHFTHFSWIGIDYLEGFSRPSLNPTTSSWFTIQLTWENSEGLSRSSERGKKPIWNWFWSWLNTLT
jgi:hypothetical protein